MRFALVEITDERIAELAAAGGPVGAILCDGPGRGWPAALKAAGVPVCRWVVPEDSTAAGVARAFERSGCAVFVARDAERAGAVAAHTARPVVSRLVAAEQFRPRLDVRAGRALVEVGSDRGPVRWITRQQLARDTKRLAAMLPSPVCGVAGVPRSGMLVAADLATRLSVPLYEARPAGGLFPLDRGERLRYCRGFSGPLVVVEDSCHTGQSLRLAAAGAAGSGVEVVSACVYWNPAAEFKPDVYAVDLPMPHLFAWHALQSPIVHQMALDFDGVICPDCPPELDDDGPKYRKWLATVGELNAPRPYRVPLIVTACLDHFRPIRQGWLDDHGIRVKEMIMGPWLNKKERAAKYDAGEFKGRAFRESRARYFLESCPTQARAIFEAAGKVVICPTTGQVFQ